MRNCKQNKPKNPKRIGPLRSPLPRPRNTSADRATAVTVLSEEGHNVRNSTSKDSSDREVFSDSNAELTRHSDKHSDTICDDGTTPPNRKEHPVINAVAHRLVDGWVSQRHLMSGKLPMSGLAGTGFRESPADHVPKRARDNDDADDQSRKRRRRNTKPAPDTAGPLVRLLTCPYQKHNPRRYSEANLAEEYRGCVSCYILDLSRLKYVDMYDGGAPSRVRRNTDSSSGSIYIRYIADQTFTASAATVFLTTATY